MSLNPKVLVIDAHPVYIDKMEGFLKGLAFHQVRMAISIKEGRKIAQEFQPDIVLLSDMYPDGESLDLLAELKQSCKNVKAIVQTGLFAEEDQIEAFRSAGAQFVIMRKEKDLAPLEDALNSIVGDIQQMSTV